MAPVHRMVWNEASFGYAGSTLTDKRAMQVALPAAILTVNANARRAGENLGSFGRATSQYSISAGLGREIDFLYAQNVVGFVQGAGNNYILSLIFLGQRLIVEEQRGVPRRIHQHSAFPCCLGDASGEGGLGRLAVVALLRLSLILR
jgi:hypothetical protein